MKSNLIFALLCVPLSARAQTTSLTLDQAISQAFASRASVQAARLRVEEAKATRRSLGSRATTTLLLGLSSSQSIGGSDDDLAVSQPVDVFGRASASRGTGDALVRQAEAALRRTEAELQNDVVLAFAETAAASERLRIARDAELAAKQLLDAVRLLVEGGRLPGVQATRVSIEFARAQSLRKQREAELSAHSAELAGILGTELVETLGGFPALVVRPVEDGALKRQRSDLLALGADVASAEAEARLVRANRLPELEVQARRSPWQQDDRYGLRVQLSIPLFDSGRSRSDLLSLDNRAKAADKALIDALRLAHAEMKAASIEVGAATEQISNLEAVRHTSRELFERTQTGLKEGANTLFDTIDALRSIRDIEGDLVEARLTLAKAQARYLHATGALLGGRP